MSEPSVQLSVRDVEQITLRRMAGMVDHGVDAAVALHRQVEDRLDILRLFGDTAGSDTAEFRRPAFRSFRRATSAPDDSHWPRGRERSLRPCRGLRR